MIGLLLGILALISGGQRYTEDQVTTKPQEVFGGGEGFGGGGAGVRNGLPEPEYIETAQGTTRLSPYQPYYEEQLVAVHAEEYAELRETRVKARKKAGIVQPEYEPPVMPVEAGGDRPGRVTR